MKKIILVCSLFLLHASFAAAKFDPAFTWKTIKTTHFAIHYHQGEEELAKRVAVIAEDVHARLVPRVKWDPKGRTHLVLVDAMDDSNGMTTPMPYNHITLFITPPLGEPGFGTMAYDEWMRLLITHEYTHILQLDMVNGAPDYLQYVFGRFYFPNLFQPIWMIEGLAVYEETEQTEGGRGRSPGSEMIIRMALLEDRFPRLSQAAVFPDFWPAGDVPYLFGESFIRFIVEKYGRGKLADISVAYSRHGVPWFVDANGRGVLGRWYSDLWDEWRDELKARYARTRDEVMARGLTASLELTKRGYLNSYPAFSPDGTRIAYLVSNADEFPGIYVMNADGTNDRKLVENTTSSTSSGGSLAWGPDNSIIYYTKLDAVRNTNFYNDIFSFDLKRNREVRVTRGLRARDPFPSPDGKKLVFVTSERGKTRLATLEIPSYKDMPVTEKNITYLTQASVDQYDTPRYSPDGSLLAVGVRQPGGYKDIWVLDTSGNKLAELMHDRAIDGGASWSPDGKAIYFASDRSGIFNLYACEYATKKIYQVTNVLGGAFTPAASPDGKALVFTSYSSRGYDLQMLPAEAASWKPAEPFKDPYPVIHYADKPVDTTASSYNPLPTLYPRFWIPWFSSSSMNGTLYGFLTYGQDAVERHSYVLTGLYSPKTYRKWYSFNYMYDGLYPTFEFSASDVDRTFSDLLSDPAGTVDYTQREKSIDVALVFPLLKIQSQHAVAVGYRRKELSALTGLPPWTAYSGAVPSEGKLVSERVSYLYNSAKQYGFSISPEDGRTVELGYERLDKALGSDFTVAKYTADWHEYLSLPWKHQVLQARAFVGTSHGDVIPQRAFQIGGDYPGDTTMSIDDDAVYLRGYPVNAFRGRKAALGSLEYRFPLADIEVGISDTPFFFRRLHAAVFGEAGNAWDDTFKRRDLKHSVGAELRLDMDIVYQFPITFRLVGAKGLDAKGESTIYLGLLMPSLF